jgi:hypothetical protein
MNSEDQLESEIEREWRELQEKERRNPTATSEGIVPEPAINRLWLWLRSWFWV